LGWIFEEMESAILASGTFIGSRNQGNRKHCRQGGTHLGHLFRRETCKIRQIQCACVHTLHSVALEKSNLWPKTSQQAFYLSTSFNILFTFCLPFPDIQVSKNSLHTRFVWHVSFLFDRFCNWPAETFRTMYICTKHGEKKSFNIRKPSTAAGLPNGIFWNKNIDSDKFWKVSATLDVGILYIHLVYCVPVWW
jgi:hypothetical protein